MFPCKGTLFNMYLLFLNIKTCVFSIRHMVAFLHLETSVLQPCAWSNFKQQSHKQKAQKCKTRALKKTTKRTLVYCRKGEIRR